MSRGLFAGVAAIAAVALSPGLALAADPRSEVGAPTVEGPIEGGLRGRSWNHTLIPLEGRGYRYSEREYFYGGTATNLNTGLEAPYKSRMLVRRPVRARDFNGVVIAEWLNVTGQTDLETAWPVEAEWLMRNGAAYVAISAQMNGICCAPMSLKGWDPIRYAPLLHPTDVFASDIFAQGLKALRAPSGADPLSGVRPEHLVATGASQSAIFLTSFINEGYTRGLVDAFVITRGGGPFDDFSTPVFHLNEEGQPEGQPDSPRYRLWEEAGTSHSPLVWWSYVWRMQNRNVTGSEGPDLIGDTCSVNRGPVDFSSRALSRWVTRYLRTGKMPPQAPRIERESRGEPERDASGLALGGIRHPHVAVPLAHNSATGCPLWGTFRPWSSERIKRLYPTHRGYLDMVRRSTRTEVRRGWMLRHDRRVVVRRAKRFKEPWSAAGCARCIPPHGL